MFSPLNLYQPGDILLWYDPSDLSTMFQDTAGTTPVTADGQSVALIRDKGPGGYHRTQASGPSMPKYKTDGTLHWLLYDGSDDHHATSSINWGTDKFDSCSGLYKANDTAAIAFEFSASLPSNSGSFYVVAGNNGGNGWSSSARGSAVSNSLQTATQLTAAPETAVITALGDVAGDLSRIWRNRIVGTDGTLDKGAGNFGKYALYFGRRGGASLPFGGREFQTVIRSRSFSNAERASTETFVAGKTGVTL